MKWLNEKIRWNMWIWMGRYLFLFVMRSEQNTKLHLFTTVEMNEKQTKTENNKTNLLEMHAPTCIKNKTIIVMHIWCSTISNCLKCSNQRRAKWKCINIIWFVWFSSSFSSFSSIWFLWCSISWLRKNHQTKPQKCIHFYS